MRVFCDKDRIGCEDFQYFTSSFLERTCIIELSMVNVSKYEVAAVTQFKPTTQVLRHSRYGSRDGGMQMRGSPEVETVRQWLLSAEDFWDNQFTTHPVVTCKNNQIRDAACTSPKDKHMLYVYARHCFNSATSFSCAFFLPSPWESCCLVKLSKWMNPERTVHLQTLNFKCKDHKSKSDYITFTFDFLWKLSWLLFDCE